MTSEGTENLFPLRARQPAPTYLRQMWDRRFFIISMPLERLRSTHQITLLGNLWHLGNPILSVLVYYLVFGVAMQVDRGVDNYIAWLTVGVTVFGMTSAAVNVGATSITANESFMRSMRFPRAILPAAVVAGRLMTFLVELLVVAFVALITGEGISLRWFFLPAVLFVHTSFVLGLAFIAARLNDTYSDVQQLIPFIFRMLMYLSGVMFPIRGLEIVENSATLSWIVDHNPLSLLIDLYRWVFLGTTVAIGPLVNLLIFTTVLLLWGFRFFRLAELEYGRK